jgi:hypothetical protein
MTPFPRPVLRLVGSGVVELGLLLCLATGDAPGARYRSYD